MLLPIAMPEGSLKHRYQIPRELANRQCQLGSAESRLIIACSQVAACRGDRNAEIRELLKANIDWNAAIALATRNGVLPLFATALRSHFRGALPIDVDSTLGEFLRKHTANNLFLTSQMIEVVQILKLKGIDVLPFKGPSLAFRAYGSPILRHYVDLDLLVKPGDFERALAILCCHGYLSNSRIGRIRRSLQVFTQRKDVVLTSPDGRVHIELHWKLSGAHFAQATRESHLWERLQRREIGGSKLLSMQFNDIFFYLCLHGTRHEWERLGWLTDVLELIESEERLGNAIEWNKLIDEAVDRGCARIVRLTLFLLKRFFQKSTIENISNSDSEHSLFEVISREIESRILAGNVSRRNKLEKKTYLLSLQEKRSQRIILQLVYGVSYLRILLLPNELDKSVIRLPRALHSVYFVLRPFRLIADRFGINRTRHKASFD